MTGVVEPRVELVAARPRPSLAPFVGGYSGYVLDGQAPGLHRGLPSRHLTLVVTVDGTVDLAGMPDPAQPPASFTALVGGLHAAPALIATPRRQHGVQVALTPLGARALLGLPAGALGPTIVDLATLLGPVADELVERVRGGRTWRERFAALDGVLARAARTARPPAPPAPELRRAWARLCATRGAVGVSALADEVGWSRRHLGERFRREFGLSPKAAARVLRFEAAHRLLLAPRRPGLAELAARCGYYDQAHLAREFRGLAGCSPSTRIAEELPNVQAAGPDGPPG